MTLEQLYIKSLDIPAVEFKITGKYIDTVFKSGKILTSRYQAMLNQLPRQNDFTILQHSQTLFTFCFIKGTTAYLIGPEIINIPQVESTTLNDKIIYLSKRLNTTILEKEQCYKQILFFTQLIQQPIDRLAIDNAFAHAKSANQLNDAITAVNFNDKGVHIRYVYENALKDAVMLGDAAAIHDTFIGLLNSGRIGILSDQGRIRSVKNWGIICVSVTLRSAISAGIDYDQAYSLNDQYVRTIEALSSLDEVMHTIEEILKDMAQRVDHLRNVHLSANCRYIYQLILDSPETKLTIPQISNQLGLSPHHLSTLFKREVGVSITRFKLLVKLNRAVQLIHTTNLPLSEIAAALNFADQSHLTREFKAFVGVSPSAARKNPHLTATWNLYNFLTINLG